MPLPLPCLPSACELTRSTHACSCTCYPWLSGSSNGRCACQSSCPHGTCEEGGATHAAYASRSPWLAFWLPLFLGACQCQCDDPCAWHRGSCGHVPVSEF